MTETAPVIVTAKQRALIFAGVILGYTVLLLALARFHPYSNLFYPFVGFVLVAGIVRIYRRGPGEIGAGSNPPKSVEFSLSAAAIAFLVTLVFFYGYVSLLKPDLWLVAPALCVSAMNGLNIYRSRRGHSYAMWPSVVLLAVFLVVLEGYKLVGGRFQ